MRKTLAMLVIALMFAAAAQAGDRRQVNTAIVPVVDSPWPGKIVVSADEWLLRDFGLLVAPDGRRFALNLADWFTGGRPGKFLAYSPLFGQREIVTTMTGAGHSWTVRTDVDFTLATLLQYDAVFLAGTPADNDALIDYVRAGGNVYLEGGTGRLGAAGEAATWNAFLNAFGLEFKPEYERLFTQQIVRIPESWTSPVFAGVREIYWADGNPITQLDPGSSSTRLYVIGTTGMFATYDVSVIPVAVGICPNVLHLDGEGSISITIAHAGNVDPAQIDPASVRLLGAPARKGALHRGVAPPVRPLLGKAQLARCDGRGDMRVVGLVLQFDTPEIAQALVATLGRTLAGGDAVVLSLTGRLKPEFGGTAIVGEDLVLIKGRQSQRLR